MLLFLLFIIFVTLNRKQWDTWELYWQICDNAGDAWVMWYTVDEGEQFVMWEVEVSVDISLLGLEPMPYTSVALIAQYLNVRQRKLGTIIFQTVHIQLPKKDVWMANSNYFN